METHIALKTDAAEKAMRGLGLTGTITGGKVGRKGDWLIAYFDWDGDMPDIQQAMQLEHSANMLISTEGGRVVITALVAKFAQAAV